MRKLTKQSIKPIIGFVKGWSNDIHSLNTVGSDHYHFTLDTYKGKNSFQGGFAWGLNGCYSLINKAYDQYALNLKTGDVHNLETEEVVMKGVL